MSRFDSDRDHSDYLRGPYRRANAVCPDCRREFWKGADDTGDLCDGCADRAWLAQKARNERIVVGRTRDMLTSKER